MKTFSGTVVKVFEKHFGDNPDASYSFFLQEVKGLFLMGRKRPSFERGSSISFETDDGKQNGDRTSYNVKWDSVQIKQHQAPVVTEQPTTQQQTMPPAVAPSVASTSPAGPRLFLDSTSRSICRQVSLKAAVALAAVVLREINRDSVPGLHKGTCG